MHDFLYMKITEVVDFSQDKHIVEF